MFAHRNCNFIGHINIYKMKNIIKVPVDISTIKKVIHNHSILLMISANKQINHPDLKLYENGVINNDDTGESEPYYKYISYFRSLNKPEGLEEILTDNKSVKNISIQVQHNEMSFKDVDWDSNKYYHYDHQDIEVECRHCNETFRISELENYCSDDYEIYETDLCPHCETPNCVYIVYERLHDDTIKKMVESGEITVTENYVK